MILVTGGTGFVGYHLVRRLLAEGHGVRVVTRNPPSASAVGPEYIRGDLSDLDSLTRALNGVRTVVHLAACLEGPRVPPGDVERVNVAGTALLARCACAAGVERIVHASSAGVYGDGNREVAHREGDPANPSTPYEHSKVHSEGVLRETLEGTSTSWVVLRPAGIYGPGRPATASFFRQVQMRHAWLHSGARVIVHPTFVDDMVQAVRSALERKEAAGLVFNIAGERALPFPELVALVGVRLGRTPRQITAPRWVSMTARTWTRAAEVLGRQPPGIVARLGREILNRSLDTTQARVGLSFAPVPLEEGIDRTITWMRNEAML